MAAIRRIVASFAIVDVTVFGHTSAMAKLSGRTDWDCSHSSETNRSSSFNFAVMFASAVKGDLPHLA